MILLIVLGVAAVCAMAWYILVGHNWNQAATHIDDMVGSMDGYTVIVYEGVVKKPKSDSGSSTEAKTMKLATNSSSSASSDAAGSGSSAGASSEAADSGSSSSTASDASASSSSSGASASGSSSGASASSSSSGASASGSANADDEPAPLDVDIVGESYREKGATVIKIDSHDMRFYKDPVIVSKHGRRTGIFSFEGRYRYHFPEFRSSIRYLQNHSTDYIICLAKDKALLKGRLNGIDLLVLLRDADIREGGEYRGQTLCVDSPYVGEVQAIIISPSGVMTSRTVKEL